MKKIARYIERFRRDKETKIERWKDWRGNYYREKYSRILDRRKVASRQEWPVQPSKLESCNFLPGNILEYSTEKTGS